MLAKSKTFQHEVKIEIENIDKNKNFIGQIYGEDGSNLGVALVEAGYAAVHRSAFNSPYYSQLSAAETRAKEKKLNVSVKFCDPKKSYVFLIELYLNSAGRTLLKKNLSIQKRL